MSDKPKFVVVTDPAEVEELTRDPADMSQPMTYKPNGHLWAVADQYEAWRRMKESNP